MGQLAYYDVDVLEKKERKKRRKKKKIKKKIEKVISIRPYTGVDLAYLE